MQTDVSLFDAVGGMPFFETLVGRFYDGVAGDPELLSVYPRPDDLREARRKLTLFLAEYWGGPPSYFSEYGHPRLRMRHVSFDITPDARDRWLAHMRAALETMSPPPPIARALLQYFDVGAEALRNRD